MAMWESTGYDEKGKEFPRRGRATVVLARSDGRWAAIHTHLSLLPDVSRSKDAPTS
jgi:ketosteroid isomerase-like protein